LIWKKKGAGWLAQQHGHTYVVLTALPVNI
jgi:hypothetical protein